MPRGAVSIRLKYNHLPKVRDGLAPLVASIQKQRAEDIRDRAKAKAPVRTGFHRANIVAEQRGQDWLVHARAPYAYFLEFGTRYMAARPHLRPAADELWPAYVTDFDRIEALAR